MEPIAAAAIVTLDHILAIRHMLGTIGCTSGGFDPIHAGHIKLLLRAKAYCDTFVVFVSGDEFLRQKKGQHFMEHLPRCAIVAGIRGVDYVVPYANEPDMTVSNGLRVLRPHVFLKGGDRVDRATIPEYPLCEELGIKVIVPEDCRTKAGLLGSPDSSAYFLNRWKQGHIPRNLG